MKICILHFRTGQTDGASLQIDERVKILRELGHQVYLVGDNHSPNADLKLDLFNYKTRPEVIKVQEEAFGENGGKANTKVAIEKMANAIELALDDFWQKKQFTFLFVHNLFSLPVCLPATIAVYEFIKNHPKIKAVGVNLDFYWDPPRIEKFRPWGAYISDVLTNYFPPQLPNLRHTVLSHWEKRKLSELKNIKSEIITDTFDFDQELWNSNPGNQDFLKDVGLDGSEIKLLLASRIRPRKGIELGIEFAAALAGITDKKVVLILPNDYSAKENDYIAKLKLKAQESGVDVRWIQELVGSSEQKKKGIKKYSLWDTYVYADAILYPSLWEGFGNQFLEAVFAKKPVVVYPYEVFKTDIIPNGFKVVTLPEKLEYDSSGLATLDKQELEKTAGKLLSILNNGKNKLQMVETNFRIGRQKFNTNTQLKSYLSQATQKVMTSAGAQSIVSPILLSGKLIASGVPIQEAFNLAETIISEIPGKGITKDAYLALVIKRLQDDEKKRYVTIEVAKDYLRSDKSKSPLFIFLGGLSGKSTLANIVVQHLAIESPISFDNEKYLIAIPGESKPFLLKATYESAKGYTKTVDAMYPYLIKMIKRNLYDYNHYRKWCYFWEGIYLSSVALKRLKKENGDINFLSVFLLPKFSEIKKQYLMRWQNELGMEKLKKRKNVIDGYLKNVSAIRSHIADNADPVASFVIESSVLEERLSIFYAVLYQKLKDIVDAEIPGWVEKIVEKPERIKDFRKFLEK